MRKIIALVLAIVMTFALVISAGASYVDRAQITKTEAADILDYLGIMTGSNGRFGPKQILSREQAAKIIAIFYNGSDDIVVNRFEKAPFTDIDSSSWSYKFINFCYQKELVSGTSSTTFEPKASLTGHAFLKMVLCAMGYDAADEGFTGSNWTKKVEKAAAGALLTLDMSGFNAEKPLCRENAAQIILNALKSHRVSYVGGVRTAEAFYLCEHWDLQFANTDKYIDKTGRPGHAWYCISTGEQIGTVYHGCAPDFVLTSKVSFHDLLLAVGVAEDKGDWVLFTVNGANRDMCHWGENHSGCAERVANYGRTEVYYVGMQYVDNGIISKNVPHYIVLTVG